MPDRGPSSSGADAQDLPGEIARLNKIVRALMDRAERSINAQTSDFGQFQTTVMLEDEVRRRTAELEAALAENVKINRTLRNSEARFRGLVSQSLVGITITEDGKFTYSNAKFDEIFGYTADEVRRLGPLETVTPEDRLRAKETIRRRVSGEVGQVVYIVHGLRKNGETIDVEIHGNSMEIDGKLALISLVVDVTERLRIAREFQALQEKLREQSFHDALTGLYNRRYLDDVFGGVLIAAKRGSYPVSAIMADLDHFKDVNDHFGHLAGDEVLRASGDLLRRYARGSDIWCRYGGEEFLLILPQAAQAVAVVRAEQLRGALAAAQVLFGGATIPVTASFGVATFPQDGVDADAIIAAADGAMYAAKLAGRNRVSATSEPARSEAEHARSS